MKNSKYKNKLQMVKLAIDLNENLSIVEKKAINTIYSLVVDHVDYLDFNHLINVLSNLKITYKTYEDGIDLGASAICEKNIEDDNILINLEFYGMKKADEIIDFNCFKNTPKSVFFHELFHALECKLYFDSNDVVIVNEVLNEIYVKEYTNLEPMGYKFFLPLGYMLLELFEKETIKKYKALDDIEFLSEELMDIYPDNKLANKFIETIINSFSFLDLYLSADENEYKLRKEMLKENQKNFYCIYKFYYEMKNSKLLEEHIELMLLIHESIYDNRLSNKAIQEEFNIDMSTKTLLDKLSYENDKVVIGYLDKFVTKQVKSYISTEAILENKSSVFLQNDGYEIKEICFKTEQNNVKSLKRQR